jgi:zinc/manganese transport system substrate-binding protein
MRPAGALLFLLAASAAGAAPLRVATLSTVLTEIAAEIGGPDVSVRGILAPGVDPHTFEPAPADLRAIADADLVLASGLGLEEYLDRLAANSGPGGRLLDLGRMLGDGVFEDAGDGRREPDPHWWHSIAAMKRVSRRVADAFAALRPGDAAGFRSRCEACVARLDALDAWARGEIGRIPPNRRRLVTTHAAFGWFARDYGFAASAIMGVSTEGEPDARGFARLAELIRREGIPAIFTESSENPKLAEALARESGAKLGGELYADGLAPEPDGSTYERMFRHNVRVIVAGLR